MSALRAALAALLRKGRRTTCDECAFVEFFRSSGDGQVPRLNAFCRCPGGPYQDRPIPPARRCERFQQREGPAEKPAVGDPTLTV
ncbi:MAG TPA: hypothetical protein PLP66_16115 [Phycisphaerae bacterium]|nr:hypothetical protein [Phycisphaerae bacterium]